MTATSAALEVAPELERWRPAVQGRRFIWLLSPPWDDVSTRQNHFAMRLARLGAEILYVENPSAWSSVLKQRRWRELPFAAGARVRQVEPRLHIMRAAFALPGAMHSDRVAEVNGQLLARQIAQWTESRRWSGYTCWCRTPHSLFTLRHLHAAGTVYDITDDYELYETDPAVRELVKGREHLLVNRADAVFLTTNELAGKDALRHRNTQIVPNGVEYELFAAASRPGPIHPLVAGVRKPVIGYVGLTSHWMDFELLEMLGRRWPGQIVMVGPIAAGVEARARSIPGVVWAGFVPQRELGPYIRGFNVSIMPHIVSELRRRANPLKIWEYLAMGKPFISCDLPALDPVRHLVSVAANREGFVQAVAERLGDAAGYDGAAAQAVAKTYSWDNIFNAMMPQLEPLLAGGAA